MDNSNSERRKYSRKFITTPIRVSKMGQNTAYETIAKDFSEGGLRFFTQKFYPYNSKLKFEIFTGSKDDYYTTFGTIKWIRKQRYGTYYNVGVSFEEVEEEIKTSLDYDKIEKTLQDIPATPYKLSV